MFTGIITELGVVSSYDSASYILSIACSAFITRRLPKGASVAINGVCLTVSHIDEATKTIDFDLGLETRTISLLTKLKPKDLVNIEFSLAMGASMDGHMVQGHVDGVVEITSLDPTEGGLVLTCSAPKKLMPFLVTKGSVALNGVSLTINDLQDSSFSVCLVPYTLNHTCFQHNKVGDLLHIETDLVGRYIHQFYLRQQALAV